MISGRLSFQAKSVNQGWPVIQQFLCLKIEWSFRTIFYLQAHDRDFGLGTSRLKSRVKGLLFNGQEQIFFSAMIGRSNVIQTRLQMLMMKQPVRKRMSGISFAKAKRYCYQFRWPRVTAWKLWFALGFSCYTF